MIGREALETGSEALLFTLLEDDPVEILLLAFDVDAMHP